ncbi:winged helix-turn-helix domain-containing protein [Nocardia sp. NPDC005998]|uniref:winged helix-turn-helix domain-containing protein n=1 Tax=Nocardia sp. NPDC005998 TaxID=3156894 RepID=UPI0033AD8337
MQPPVCSDPNEDWVRAPISQFDLKARVAALRNRSSHTTRPVLDRAGLLFNAGLSVAISSSQAELVDLFIQRFGEIVYRHELEQRLADNRIARPTRNSLDLHIMRLRRRLIQVELLLNTAHRRGYLLQQVAA